MGCVRTILLSLLAAGTGTNPLGAQRVERNVPYRANPTPDQHMDVYVPATTPRAPVVLFIHGGSLEEAGERRNSPMYAPVCPGLAQRGILCVTMDYRLAPAYRWPAMPQDVAAAVRWLKDSIAARGGDPERVFLIGHSSGCHLAALVALDTGYLAEQGLHSGAVAGVVAMGCTLAPWDTAGRAVTQSELEQAFTRDEQERRVYGSLAWRLRANPTSWVGSHAPPFLVLVAESERYMPAILEEGARFVRLLRERERSADLRILSGRRHVTTTTGFADPADTVGNLVAAFVRNPRAVTATP
jgi:acetyl esterase/lipase